MKTSTIILIVLFVLRFLDEVANQNRDVYFVTVNEAIEWVRNPKTSVEIVSVGFPPWEDENRTPNCPNGVECRWSIPAPEK